MGSISGGRNRALLAIGGILSLAIAGWVLISALALPPRIGWNPRWFADPQIPFERARSPHAAWLAPAGIAASVLAVIAAAMIMLAQVPRRPTASRLRLTGPDGENTARLDAPVLARALQEHLETLTGVDKAALLVLGSARAPRVRGTVTIDEKSELRWVLPAVRERIERDVDTVLGNLPTSVDLIVRLSSRVASGDDRSADVAVHAPGLVPQPEHVS